MARARRMRRFGVFLGVWRIGFVEAATIPDALRKLDLTFCTGRREPARRLCSGHALHGHVPAHHVDSERRMVTLPHFGAVRYNNNLPVPPAITLRLVMPQERVASGSTPDA